MEDVDDYLDLEDVHRVKRDFFEELSHRECIEHFRFDKESVRRLIDLLQTNVFLDNFHGLSVEQQV